MEYTETNNQRDKQNFNFIVSMNIVLKKKVKANNYEQALEIVESISLEDLIKFNEGLNIRTIEFD